MSRALAFIGVGFLALTTPGLAQVTFSGVAMWLGDSSGAPVAGYWDTQNNNSIANVYLTGLSGLSLSTSGDTNVSLNPNLSLTPGTYVIRLAGETSSGFGVGINLYFDGDLTNNRISAFVPFASSSFSVVTGATQTKGELGVNVAGSGSLSYSAGGMLVTLSGFSALAAGALDIVQYYDNVPNGGPDTVATMTLTVTAIPETSTSAMFAGLAALCFVVWRKRHLTAPTFARN